MMQIFADLYHTSLIDMSVPEASPEGLFFSSPGIDDTRRGPEDEVPVLVARAIQVTTLGPAVDNFMALHKDAFLSMFARQINLIKSRSQAFEDGHITVFDKTLLTLTQNGTDLDNPAAIQYYCEEFLGIHFGASTGEASRVLSQAIDVPESLIKETSTTHVSSDVKTEAEADAETQAERLSTAAEEMEPKLKRLWEVYEKAKSDYFAVSDSKSNDLVGAAKFLRDTAENTQQYLTDKSIDPIMLAELQSTYNMAKATVVSLTGGKKRKFDAVDMEWMRSAPRAPSGSEQNLNSWRPARSNQYPYPSRSSDSGYGAGTYSYRDNNNAADTDRGQSSKSEHRASRRRSSSPREYHGRSPRERSRDREHDRHRDRDREREASRDRDGRRYGSKRGHSGIPYGYRRDREVDSYQPRRYKDDLSD